jgi:hypothetical protein
MPKQKHHSGIHRHVHIPAPPKHGALGGFPLSRCYRDWSGYRILLGNLKERDQMGYLSEDVLII